MSEESKVKKFPKEYYASFKDLKNPKWRRFRPWPARQMGGYEMKAGIVAIRLS